MVRDDGRRNAPSGHPRRSGDALLRWSGGHRRVSQKPHTRLSDLVCKVVGYPKPVSTAGPQGRLVALNVDGQRVVYFLCAHIADDDWLVHRGSFKDGVLDETDAFQEKDLVVKNIRTEAWGQTRNRHLRSSDATNTMRNLVQGGDYTWRRCVAVATYRAEGIRSKSSGTFNAANQPAII